MPNLPGQRANPWVNVGEYLGKNLPSYQQNLQKLSSDIGTMASGVTSAYDPSKITTPQRPTIYSQEDIKKNLPTTSSSDPAKVNVDWSNFKTGLSGVLGSGQNQQTQSAPTVTENEQKFSTLSDTPTVPNILNVFSGGLTQTGGGGAMNELIYGAKPETGSGIVEAAKKGKIDVGKAKSAYQTAVSNLPAIDYNSIIGEQKQNIENVLKGMEFTGGMTEQAKRPYQELSALIGYTPPAGVFGATPEEKQIEMSSSLDRMTSDPIIGPSISGFRDKNNITKEQIENDPDISKSGYTIEQLSSVVGPERSTLFGDPTGVSRLKGTTELQNKYITKASDLNEYIKMAKTGKKPTYGWIRSPSGSGSSSKYGVISETPMTQQEINDAYLKASSLYDSLKAWFPTGSDLSSGKSYSKILMR